MGTIRTVRFAVFLVGYCAQILCSAQNLVPNSGFEEFLSCPGSYSQSPNEFRVNQWQSASLGTPDHFHTCSIGEADVPYNWAGVSDAYEGKGYAGIYVWMGDLPYREYLQCRLLEPLIKDTTYIVELHFKLSSYSKYSVDRIGLLLNDSAMTLNHYKVFRCEPTISVIQDSALTRNTGLWETARREYRAKGGEQFLVIGNFFDNESTKNYKIQFRPVSQEMLGRGSYYYIDDVKIIPRHLPEELLLTQLVPEFGQEKIRPNKNYVLKNIQFEYDSYKLTPSSFAELNVVADYLNENSDGRVQLFGHTDDQGSELYNMQLSLNRAKSAASYLVSLGLNQERVEVYGFGKTQPLIESKTEEARKVNRRVEVRFVD